MATKLPPPGPLLGSSLGPWIRRLPRNPAFWYVAALAAMWPVLHLLPSERVHALRTWASTDLGNLHLWPEGHPIESLTVSVFVPQDTIWVWPVFALSLFAVVGALGARRAVASVALVHVAATALTEGLVWWRIEHGSLPAEAAHAMDTGPSYVVVTALTLAATRARPAWSRAVWLLMLAVAAPALLAGLPDGDTAAVGHLVSLLAGLALAAAHRFGLPPLRRRTPAAPRPETETASGAAPASTPGATDPDPRPARAPSR
ncbi:rhomboid-like protein [Kitasatospora purpeofusca]|uniref:rhomboid-like protein n=1 Tax=Kitasatospora purpeofusca TaxID=67352 RepID=UPI0038003ABD